MSGQNGPHLAPPALSAAHLLDSTENSSSPASRQSPLPGSRSDLTELSPVPDAIVSTRSTQSGFTTAPASPPSQFGTPDETEATAGAPYGTRSRQRTGAPRPNYAEDKDLDMDVETNGAHTKPTGARRSGAATSSYHSETDRGSAPPTRRGFTAVNGVVNSSSGQSPAPKDSIPGTSTFAANPSTSTASKKRKQPGSSATPTTVSNHYVATRPKGQGWVNGRFQPESNMMAFERCGGYLNAEGQLKADDGTAISING
jgi:hypothetical protein